MIFGLYTFSDATYQHGSGRSTGLGVKAQDPTGATNVGIGADATQATASQNNYMMPDEQIFAIEYRSLTWKTFRRKKVETVVLAENRWEIFSGDRSKGNSKESEDGTVVDFDLGDSEFEEFDDDVIPFQGD